MRELEKMLAGEIYDCGDEELMEMWHHGKNLMQKYNQTPYDDKVTQKQILKEWLGNCSEQIQITAPFFVDYGKFIHIGNNTEINMNCVFLDCNHITIGENVLIGPGVHIYTVYHPLQVSSRMMNVHGQQFPFAVGLTKPVEIKDNTWIGGGSVIMPGVTIGTGVTIGAGSVVTKSIPDHVLAYGNPCKVIRKLDE